MKKLLYAVVLLALVVGIAGCGSKTTKVTLADIAEKFNNSKTIKSYKEFGYEITATANNNELVITSKMGDENSSVSYKFENNILSNEKVSEEDLITALILIDSVGQAHGYKDGELADNLNAFPEDIIKYTVEKEGLEIKTGDETNSIKIDISKKIPLKDMAGFYLKTDDFDMIADIVENETSGNQTGKVAKIGYDVRVDEEESYIYIGETDKLTESAYKSVLSALEVMYGKKAVDYFKQNYPAFKDGKTEFEGFIVDTNYQKEDQDESVFKGMKIVAVTINNAVVADKF